MAKSILLRGAAQGEEVYIALEFLNFPPIDEYSKELRKVCCASVRLIARAVTSAYDGMLLKTCFVLVFSVIFWSGCIGCFVKLQLGIESVTHGGENVV